MTDFREQAAVAQRANFDFFFGVAGKMLEGEEKLVRLNLDTTRTAFADWYQRMQAGLTTKEGHEVTELENALVLPSAEKVTTYERQVAEIVSAMQTHLAEVVDAQCQEVNRQVQWFVENVAQNTPVGSEAAIAFLKQSASLASTAYENVRKATKEAVEIVVKAAKVTKQ
jgi:phasin family protein